MKIYISGPITGRDKDEYIKHFTKVEIALQAEGYQTINPARMNAYIPEEGTSHDDYMAVSIAELSICEGIIMLRGWRDSIGAKEEFNYAAAHSMPILFESTFTGERE